MKAEVPAKKMHAAEARFISLVRRAANGTAFRIQKSAEETMALDLTNPNKILQGVRPSKTATISAVVVRQSDDLDKVKEQITKAGLSVDKPIQKEDGTVLFAQDDKPEEGAVAVRMSQDLVLVMKSFEPWAMEAKSFADRIGLTGYYNGLYTAGDALRECFYDCVYEAETHKEMVDAVSSVCDDFKAYVIGLAKAIPETAYKLDEGLKGVTMSQKEPVEEACGGKKKKMMKEEEKKTDPNQVAAAVEPAKTEEKPMAETTVTTPVPVVEKKTEPVAVPVAEPAKVPEQKSEQKEPTLADVMAALSNLGTRVAEVVTVQKSQGETLTALQGQIKITEQKTAEVDEKLKGTVAAPPPVETTKVVEKKSDSEGPDYYHGGLDTGFRR